MGAPTATTCQNCTHQPHPNPTATPDTNTAPNNTPSKQSNPQQPWVHPRQPLAKTAPKGTWGEIYFSLSSLQRSFRFLTSTTKGGLASATEELRLDANYHWMEHGGVTMDLLGEQLQKRVKTVAGQVRFAGRTAGVQLPGNAGKQEHQGFPDRPRLQAVSPAEQ